MRKLEASEAAKNALENILEAKKNEKILIICDEEKSEIGEAFTAGALNLKLRTRLVNLKKPKEPRKKITEHLQDYLIQKPDIFINLLTGNREETPFRIELIKSEINDDKSRIGHCPGITLDMLTNGALALKPKQHKRMQTHANRLIYTLEETEEVEVNYICKL